MATYNQSQMTLPSGDVVKFIDNTSGYTKNTGTITKVTAGTGLSGGGTSGSVTLNHSNSVTAQTTQAVYPIKIDAQGHISAYGAAVTIPSAVTESTVSGWGFTKNTGTVTSVRVQATSPVSSSVSTAQSGSLNTTISLSDGYGDTKNPYGVKDAHVVLAGPSTGADAAPTFRALVADDIPSITKSKISDFPTSMTPTSHAHGNITNAGDITTTSTIANGDRLVINDESASKVTNSSITFGTSTSTYLRNDGTWGTPSGTATGTITGVTAGAGLSGGGTSGTVTLKHSNSVKAQTTQAVYPIKIDAQGHISAYGSAVTIPEDKLFLVTATMSGLTTGTSDKSVTEIAAAVAAGKFVYIKTTVGTTTITAPLMHVVDTVDVSKAVFNYDDQQNSSQLYHAVLEITGTTVTITWTNEKYARESQIPDSTSDLTNDSGFITAATAPVTSVNSKTGDVVLTIPAAVAVKGNAETSYRTGNVNLTPANIGAATSNHTHTTSLATSTGTSTITLAHGSKYQLTAGGTSVIFTMPADSNTDTKVTNTLATTTKYYVTGTTSASTNTGTQSFDSGIYSTTTAGQLNATTYLVNEKVRLEYNSTTKSLDFIFI